MASSTLLAKEALEAIRDALKMIEPEVVKLAGTKALKSVEVPTLPDKFQDILMRRRQGRAEWDDPELQLSEIVEDLRWLGGALANWRDSRPGSRLEYYDVKALEDVVDALRRCADQLEDIEFPAFHAPRKYTFNGSYPQMLVRGGRAYCTTCAHRMRVHPEDVIDVNWENADLYCADCEQRIESAYAEERKQ